MFDASFKQFVGKGITAMCTLTKKGQRQSFQDMKITYDLTNQDFFRYLQIQIQDK